MIYIDPAQFLITEKCVKNRVFLVTYSTQLFNPENFEKGCVPSN